MKDLTMTKHSIVVVTDQAALLVAESNNAVTVKCPVLAPKVGPSLIAHSP